MLARKDIPSELLELSAQLTAERNMRVVDIRPASEPGQYECYWKAPSLQYDFFVAPLDECIARIPRGRSRRRRSSAEVAISKREKQKRDARKT